MRIIYYEYVNFIFLKINISMEKQKNKYRILLLFIIFLTSFSLGFIVKENFYTTEKQPYIEDLKQEDNFTNVNNYLNNLKQDEKIDLSLFWIVYDIVKNYYYSNDLLNEKENQYWIISWFIESLWDKFSEFMTPEITKEFNDALKGDFEWIGAVVQKHELWVLIDRVLKWSPALNNWILSWDIIIEANENILKGLSVNESVNFIKWPAWTQVVLKILRVWERDIIEKKVIRDKIKIPSVDTKDIAQPNIGYISLNMFWENTPKEFKEFLDMYNNDENIDWIIIDLRDNWGGYLQTAVEIISNFIPRGEKIVTTKYKESSKNKVFNSNNRGNIFNKKIVVLINQNSASASEIMAWALKEYNKAILVWEKSYWKW